MSESLEVLINQRAMLMRLIESHPEYPEAQREFQQRLDEINRELALTQNR